ncbi:MAG: hypothetical protein FP826_05155 [Sphingomonadales bacterium]|nr:hypothetical protein [Sphingomonadales bacterium]MBU3993965.1 hypothetical protein [Alphaproteobacteria bacterium]
MPLMFSGSHRPVRSPLTRFLTGGGTKPASNDNHRAIADNPLLRATLTHFAAYGLSAAVQARQFAEDARCDGDAEGCDHWQAVCRLLDRRMADRIGEFSASGAASA